MSDTTNEKKDKVKRFKKKKSFSSSYWLEKIVEIKRVTKVVKGGKNLSFRALVIIGNEKKGYVGVGMGKAKDVASAVKKGLLNAKKNLISVPLTQSSTIPYSTDAKFGASKVLIKPASAGSGLISGSSSRIVLELAGVKNIVTKQLGSKNRLNNARATVLALKKLQDPDRILLNRF
uniref:Small ribosomal subunit protein uS5c n=1 Tax=Olisthodiscus luteus TaxID=83000 RepID=A0A7U0KT69_OLILU|nr:ribosomal protein S5 [Olisthodiscus luteus]QQW50580.1 ribosomal protein S5 [Olisthodiscus luteus]